MNALGIACKLLVSTIAVELTVSNEGYANLKQAIQEECRLSQTWLSVNWQSLLLTSSSSRRDPLRSRLEVIVTWCVSLVILKATGELTEAKVCRPRWIMYMFAGRCSKPMATEM